MSKVSLVKSKDSYKGVTDSLKLIEDELRKKIKNQKQIVIKINFVTTKRELATTPFKAVKAFIDFIRPFHKGKIMIAEEATNGNTIEGFKTYGFYDLAKNGKNIEIFNSGKDKAIKIIVGKREIKLAKIYSKPSFVVSITRPKTHDAVVVTLSIKNVIIGSIKHGLLKNRFKIPHDKRLNRIMTDITKYSYPSLAIIDGTVGMQGNGPANGFPISSGWVISSFDPLAADSLATYLMGFDIGDVGYLNLMRGRRLGKLYPKDKINLVGVKDPKRLVKKFKPHRTFEKQRNWR